MDEVYSSDFGGALSALRNGRKVSRKGWHLGGMYLMLQVPDSGSANTLPYIYIVIPGLIGGGLVAGDKEVNVPAQRVPWVASQTDLLSDDWDVIQEA